MAALEASVKAAKDAPHAPPDGAHGATAATRPRSLRTRGRGAGARKPQVGREPARDDGRRSADRTLDALQPRQGAVPGGRVHQGRGDRLLRPHRAGDAAAPGRPGPHLRRFPNGVDGGSFFEKRCPDAPPGRGCRWRSGPGDRNGRHRVLRARRAGGAGVGGQHGRAGAARADGAGRGPRRRPRPWCSTSTPAPPADHPRVRRGGAGDPRRAGRRRPRGVGQDVGLEGPAALRAGERPVTHERRGRRSPSPWASCWSSSSPSGW